MSFLRRILRRPKPKKHIDVPDDKSTIPQKVAEDSARCLLSGDDRAHRCRHQAPEFAEFINGTYTYAMLTGTSVMKRILAAAALAALLIAPFARAGTVGGYPNATSPLNGTERMLGDQSSSGYPCVSCTVDITPLQLSNFTALQATSYALMYNNNGIIGSLIPSATGQYCLNWASLTAAPTLVTCVSGGSSAFNAITTGTNTSAIMTVGSGASITYTGTGSVNASEVAGVIKAVNTASSAISVTPNCDYAMVKVTASGQTTASFPVQLAPPAGVLFQTLASINPNAPLRFQTLPDLAVNDQVWAAGNSAGTVAAPAGLVLNSDGSFEFAAGYVWQNFWVRVYKAADSAYTPYALITATGLQPGQGFFGS